MEGKETTMASKFLSFSVLFLLLPSALSDEVGSNSTEATTLSVDVGGIIDTLNSTFNFEVEKHTQHKYRPLRRHPHYRRGHGHHGRGHGHHRGKNGPKSVPMPMPVDLLKKPGVGKIYERHAAKEFLDAHNCLRDYFGERRYTWNRTLALYARQYLSGKRELCRKEHSGGPYGENLFWGTGGRWRAVDAVQAWAREHYYYDPDSNSCLPGKMCGHYTQMIWKSSAMLGCARIVCKTGDVVVLCSYDPPGNYVGENPFQDNVL